MTTAQLRKKAGLNRDKEYAAKQGGDKPDVSVEEFDNFMNGR